MSEENKDRRYQYLKGCYSLEKSGVEPGSIWWGLAEHQESKEKKTLVNNWGEAILVTDEQLKKYFIRIPLDVLRAELGWPYTIEQVADAVIRDTNIVERLKEAVQKGHYDERGCLDNTDEVVGIEDDQRMEVEKHLDDQYPWATFRIVEIMGGNAIDVIATDIVAKAKYDAVPKTHTRAEAYNEVFGKHHISSDIPYHADMSKKLTDEEYRSTVAFYEMMIGTFGKGGANNE